MEINPKYSDFKQKYNNGFCQVAWIEISGDLETPVSAAIKLESESEFLSLLESVEGGKSRGRYSFISLKPDIIWRCNGKKSEISNINDFNNNIFQNCFV